MTALGAQPRERRPQQDQVQPPAMDADLGMRVAGEPAAVLAVDQLAEPVEEAAFADGDAGAAELVLQAERRKLPHRMGQQGDADAELPDLRGALVHAAGDPATGADSRRATGR